MAMCYVLRFKYNSSSSNLQIKSILSKFLPKCPMYQDFCDKMLLMEEFKLVEKISISFVVISFRTTSGWSSKLLSDIILNHLLTTFHLNC